MIISSKYPKEICHAKRWHRPLPHQKVIGEMYYSVRVCSQSYPKGKSKKLWIVIQSALCQTSKAPSWRVVSRSISLLTSFPEEACGSSLSPKCANTKAAW